MYCPHCGTRTEPQNYCPSCGGQLTADPAAASPEPEHLHLLIPTKTPFTAIAAGYLGLLSILVFPAPFAIILAIVGFFRVRATPGARGYLRCAVGLIGGLIGCAILAFFIASVFMTPGMR